MKGKAALHCLKYFLGLEPPLTQIRVGVAILDALCRASSRLVEVRVFEAVTARVIAADAMSDTAKRFAVDPFFKGPYVGRGHRSLGGI